MKSFNEKEWNADDKIIACRLAPESFHGLLKKHLKVPRFTRALISTSKGENKLLDEGAQIGGTGNAIFVKSSKFDVGFTKKNLITDEGYMTSCSILLTFMAGETEFDLEQVADNLLKGKKRIMHQDIHAYLAETIEEILSSFVLTHKAPEICEMPVAKPLKETLGDGLKKLLYRGGLTFCGVSRIEFDCPEFYTLQKERSKIRGREEVLRERAKLDELEMEKTLARIEALKSVGVDPNVAIEIELGKAHQKGSRAKMLLVASGKGVSAYNPYSKEPAIPEELYLLPEKMGFARSTTVLEQKNEPVVAIGAQRGVYLVSPRNKYSGEFYIESNGRPRGGFNSVTVADELVYGAHSELGLLEWSSATPNKPSRSIFPEVTRKNKYTRGVCFHNGTVFFSSGAKVYAFTPGNLDFNAVYENGGAPITSLLVAGDSIFAGNQDGQVLHWPIEFPRQSAKVLLRRQGTIYAVSKMITERGRFILIGTRDYSTTAFDPLSGVVMQYMSPDLMRWVDGAGDFVFSSSYSGHRIFIWDISHPARHLYSIPIDEMAQDIYVWEEEQL